MSKIKTIFFQSVYEPYLESCHNIIINTKKKKMNQKQIIAQKCPQTKILYIYEGMRVLVSLFCLYSMCPLGRTFSIVQLMYCSFHLCFSNAAIKTILGFCSLFWVFVFVVKNDHKKDNTAIKLSQM
jgi:hypothetical protein